ncbi:hypothetical protein EYW98_15705 [Escherichia coli]|uniref:hypothetical protein n=1 Tax=Escherichia sp. MOD1-EC7003 TaxID=2093900 RepID=UPI0013000A3C|nr:hypothetical protein [Escherichia sp. MOD1-EC7003]EGO8360848.1 hypothetical protein [Escherichia coli]EGO8378295.1 hypothetical protein [Escherichia coli]MCH0695859.1 hypothetical protein [Escherichia coli]
MAPATENVFSGASDNLLFLFRTGGRTSRHFRQAAQRVYKGRKSRSLWLIIFLQRIVHFSAGYAPFVPKPAFARKQSRQLRQRQVHVASTHSSSLTLAQS